MRLIAVGDLVLGDTASTVGFGFYSTWAHAGLADALAEVVPVLGSGEIVFGNLESVLSERGRDSSSASSLHMRASPTFARALRHAGFTVLNVANNHANQHGDAAFADTCRSVEDAGIAVCGLPGEDHWTTRPLLLEPRPGMKVGMLAYCLHPRQYSAERPPPFAEGTREQIVTDVRRLSAEIRTIVVSLHWGLEFTTGPSREQVGFARGILEAGACLVLGHHPHIVQPFVSSGRGVIAYSLGNFVSDMLWDERLRRGAILTCELDDGAVRDAEIVDTLLDRRGAPSVAGRRPLTPSSEVPGLPDGEYRRISSEELRRIRRAKARYLVSQIPRMRPKFALQWLTKVLRNRL